MGKFYEEIPEDPKLLQWISEQKLFHVATAPLNGEYERMRVSLFRTYRVTRRGTCERVS